MSEFARIATTLSLVLLITALLGMYVTWRATWVFAGSRRTQRSLLIALLSALIAAVASRTLSADWVTLAEAFGELGGAVMLAVVISAVLLLPVELGLGLTRLLRRFGATSRAPALPERREFLARAAAGGALAVGCGSSVYGSWLGRHDYTLETVPIKLAKLPRALDGLTIVQLSDLHVGTYVRERELRAAQELVRAAKPDLIVLTGDLLDHDASYAPMLARFTRSLQGLARFGVHAIPGNHDHYAGAKAMMTALRESGTDVLFNRHVLIAQGLLLAGLDDVAGPRFDSAGPRLDLALAQAPKDLPVVMLSHNPSYFPHSYRHADLTLSGHTHGGQVTLFINPAELVLSHGLVRGHYRFEQSQLYVNRGFGTAGPPVRIGSPPEVTKIVLHV